MALETPLTATAQDRLKQVREQIDAALDALVADMLALAAAERDTALSEAQAQATAALEKACAESAATSSLQDQLAEIQAQAAKSLAEAEERAAQALAAERAEAERRVAEAQAQAAQAQAQIAETQARAAEAAAATRVEERQSDLASLERLLDGVRDLDTAGTLSQVLDKLADHAAAHVARVAVLLVRDRELRGWRTTGFGEGADPSAFTLSLDAPTVVRLAVETGAPATTANGATGGPLEPLPFAPLPKDRVGLALPVTVGVRTVAVLYADEDAADEPTVPSAWPEALEMLARHAACRLELLTMARAYGLHAQPFESARGESSTDVAQGGPQAAEGASVRPPLTPPPGGRPPSLATDTPVETGRADEARQASDEDSSALRYARLLISEIKLYHEDAVNEGRRDANLLARLGPEIARARRLYEERIPAEVRSRADHFGQELVRTLANGDPRLLGQAT